MILFIHGPEIFWDLHLKWSILVLKFIGIMKFFLFFFFLSPPPPSAIGGVYAGSTPPPWIRAWKVSYMRRYNDHPFYDGHRHQLRIFIPAIGFMYSADADGRGRTRTFIFVILFFFFFFFLHTKIYGPNWSETQSQTAWVTPPPHASWSHKYTYSLPVRPVIYLFLDFAMYTVYTRGGGGYSLYFSYAYVPPECPSFWRFFSRWQSKKLPFTLNMPYRFSS